MIPEQRLISEIMMRNVRLAIWPFRIPHESTPLLQKQYEKLITRKKPVYFYSTQMAWTHAAMNTLEWDLEEYAKDLDLGSRFYNKTFDFVQEGIHLRNKLLREQIASGKVKPIVQRKSEVKE